MDGGDLPRAAASPGRADDSGTASAGGADQGADHLPERCEALGRAVAAALGGALRGFDAQAEGTARSQGELGLAVDRLTGELDKLLDYAPLPLIMQHATKISSIRRRVATLNLLLKSIQRRIDNIDQLLSTGAHNDNIPSDKVETLI